MNEMELRQVHQQRKRCWMVFGRALLTLSVLGLITVGLYIISQRVHSEPSSTENPEDFIVRDRRDLRGEVSSEVVDAVLDEKKYEQILYKNEVDRPVRSLKRMGYATAPVVGDFKSLKRATHRSGAKSARSESESSDNQITDSDDFYDVAGNETEIINEGDIDLHNQTDYEEKVRQKKEGYPIYEHYVYVRRYKCSKKPNWHRKGTDLRKFRCFMLFHYYLLVAVI